MRIASGWSDYELLDATHGERLERWGNIILVRPDPQVIWNTAERSPLWRSPHATYERSTTGGGQWNMHKKVPEVWSINYKHMQFNLKPMGFKHTGVFPEQAVNWDLCSDIVGKSHRPLKILNLFAYTGAATLACSAPNTTVTHVDSSKGMVAWGKENAVISKLDGNPLRFLVDDCIKFVRREIRRGNIYDGIIMDPPSYGRGPSGEIWRLEDNIFEFLVEVSALLNKQSRFLLLNSYTTGLSPSVMEYLLCETIKTKHGGIVSCDEIGLPVTSTGLALPCGSTAIWRGGCK